MRITKYVHSCLLIETPERVGLIDPGNYSWKSGLFKLDAIERLDDIVITHEHQDHMDIDFMKALIAKFPDVQVITTESAAEKLKSVGISAVNQGSQYVELFETNHESMAPLTSPAPQNTGVHYLSELTHPGDSHHFDVTKKILALPITAPWGTMARACELGQQLKPQYIIPIHDWHYRDEAKAIFYPRLKEFFGNLGITFIELEDGVSIEIV